MNKLTSNAKFVELNLDNTTSISVVAGLSIATAIATVIPDPTLCKLTCAACAAWAGVISLNNVNNRGVIIAFETIYNPSGLPIPTPYWCSSQ